MLSSRYLISSLSQARHLNLAEGKRERVREAGRARARARTTPRGRQQQQQQLKYPFLTRNYSDIMILAEQKPALGRLESVTRWPSALA
jgi:hypothetical protein